MVTVALSRHFIEWQKKESIDPDLMPQLDIFNGQLTWDDLLKKQRVVILAEAGSGKTVEMQDQASRQNGAGRFAFYATVEDVGRDGLAAALTADDRKRLADWVASEQSAWFFIDSVDEAKLNNIRLDKALRGLAEAISGGERRARIVLSGRHTDWEFRKDLERLNDVLPIPRSIETLQPPTADELLINVLNQQRRQKTEKEPVETPLVVLLAPLDRGRVRVFAESSRTLNLDTFMNEIETANLWRFASRPLDLEWLVQFWRTHGRLGSLTEMIESSLTQRLSERDPGRARRENIDVTQSFEALERIGAALTFGRKYTISIPDSALRLTEEEFPIKLDEVLPNWSPENRARLLLRPVFDPATFGRARLHNDNRGVVRSYLTARWLRRLSKANLSQKDLFDLLFATTYGLSFVKPSMAKTAAWLAIWDSKCCERDRSP